MILRILLASFVALGLGLMIEKGHAAETLLCRDGRIVQLDRRDARAAIDPCRGPSIKPLERAERVPLPVKRPALTRSKVALKGATQATPAPRNGAPFQSASTDYRRVRIINAQPGAPRWYRHER